MRPGSVIELSRAQLRGRHCVATSDWHSPVRARRSAAPGGAGARGRQSESAAGAGRRPADRPARGPARARSEPRRGRARRDRRRRPEAAARSSPTARTSSSSAAAIRPTAVQAITDKLAARGDVASAEPDAMMEPFQVPTDPRWSKQWDMLDPASGLYGDQPSRRVGHHHGSSGDHGRRDRHRLSSARRPRGPLRRRATTSSATASSRTTAAAATPTPPTRATGSRAPRARAGTSRAAGRATARGTARTCPGTIGAVANNGLGVGGDQPGSRRSSRCGCSASAAATRATSPTRFAGRPG